MAETLTANINDNVDWKHQGEVGLVTVKLNGDLNRTQSYTAGNGTTAGQINEIYQDQRTLGANTTEELDLIGALTGEIRSTVDFTKIKEVIIELPTQDNQAANITIGGAANNTWPGFFADTSDKIVIYQGGRLRYSLPTVAGLPVTAGTGDKLLISNPSLTANATYNIVLLGIHA